MFTYKYIATRDEACPADARRSLQIVRCKLVDRLIVFIANRIVGELSAAGKLDTWPDRPAPMASRESRAQERQTPEFVRPARPRTIVEAIFRRNGSIFGFVATLAIPPKYRACQQKRRCGTSRCTTSCSHDVTSKNNENRLQNRSKVDQSRSSGVRRGAQVDRSWSFEASRSAKVDRSRSIEPWQELDQPTRDQGTREW